MVGETGVGPRLPMISSGRPVLGPGESGVERSGLASSTAGARAGSGLGSGSGEEATDRGSGSTAGAASEGRGGYCPAGGAGSGGSAARLWSSRRDRKRSRIELAQSRRSSGSLTGSSSVIRRAESKHLVKLTFRVPPARPAGRGNDAPSAQTPRSPVSPGRGRLDIRDDCQERPGPKPEGLPAPVSRGTPALGTAPGRSLTKRAGAGPEPPPVGGTAPGRAWPGSGSGRPSGLRSDVRSSGPGRPGPPHPIDPAGRQGAQPLQGHHRFAGRALHTPQWRRAGRSCAPRPGQTLPAAHPARQPRPVVRTLLHGLPAPDARPPFGGTRPWSGSRRAGPSWSPVRLTPGAARVRRHRCPGRGLALVSASGGDKGREPGRCAAVSVRVRGTRNAGRRPAPPTGPDAPRGRSVLFCR